MIRIVALLIFVSSFGTLGNLSQDRVYEKGQNSFPVYIELHPAIDSILRKYADISCFNDRVIQFFVYSYPDSAVFIIKHCQYYHEVFEHNISGYLNVDNCLIIIYTDLDLLFKKDPRVLYNFKKELEMKHLKKQGEGPSMIDSPPWIVSYNRKNNRIVVVKKAIEPYFKKVKIDTLYRDDVFIL